MESPGIRCYPVALNYHSKGLDRVPQLDKSGLILACHPLLKPFCLACP